MDIKKDAPKVETQGFLMDLFDRRIKLRDFVDKENLDAIEYAIDVIEDFEHSLMDNDLIEDY